MDILSGFAFDSNQFAEDGPIPIVRIRDVGANGNRTFYRGSYDSRYVLNDGDMLIAMDGEFRRARWEGGPALLNQRVCRIKPSNPNLDERYLFHFLPKALQQIEAATPFATVKHLSTKTISQIQMPLPPLEEQRRIADILDKAYALRAKRQAALSLLDALKRSAFATLFGDSMANDRGRPTQQLRRVCDETNDCPHTTPRWTTSGVRCLRTSNLTAGGWNWDDSRYVTESDYHQRSKRGYLAPGDIVLSREGTVGVLAIVPDGVPMCMGQRLVQLRPTMSQVVPEYLLGHLLAVLAPGRIAQTMAGSTSRHLNLKDLRALTIPIPPLELQTTYRTIADQTERLRDRCVASLVQVDTLLASLQHRAFRGDL